MYVSVNNKNEIKQVGVSTDPNLTSLYINDEENPFKGWSEVKICCYKVNVTDGIVMMMTPYVDSRLLDHFDQVGGATDDNSEGLFDTAEATSDISDALFELADYVAELEARIVELEESEE